MVDFLRHLSPEARQRIEWLRRAFEEDVAECRGMTVEQLCERAEYYLNNCEFKFRYQPGEPVYDGVVAHVVIPELIRRLREALTVGTPPTEQRNEEKDNGNEEGC